MQVRKTFCWLKKLEGLDLFFFFDKFCVCAKFIKKRPAVAKTPQQAK